MKVPSLLSWFGRAIHWLVSPEAKPIWQAGGELAAGFGFRGTEVFTAILRVVGNAEAVGEIVKGHGGSKLDKMTLVLPQVESLIRNSEAVAGREILDEVEFSRIVQGYAQLSVDLAKVVGEKPSELNPQIGASTPIH